VTTRDAQRHLVNEIVLDEVSLDTALDVVGATGLTSGSGADRDVRSGASHTVTYAMAQLLKFADRAEFRHEWLCL
jgi:hypothetical protein